LSFGELKTQANKGTVSLNSGVFDCFTDPMQTSIDDFDTFTDPLLKILHHLTLLHNTS